MHDKKLESNITSCEYRKQKPERNAGKKEMTARLNE
jgi:hypothetical protein